jgi:hypothetical protein
MLIDHIGDRLHPRQRLDAALRLTRLRGLGLEAGDERLDVAPLIILLLLQLEIKALPFPTGFFKGIVAA